MSENISPSEHLAQVQATFDGTADPRTVEIVRAAVKHLHAFIEEVGLTRDEWFAGIQFLTATGQMCDPTRQEFILLSDTLGVSSLVEMVTHHGVEGSTENTVLQSRLSFLDHKVRSRVHTWDRTTPPPTSAVQ